MTEYERKFEAAMTELVEKGMWSKDYMPPLLKAQRALGLRSRPPHYLPFWRLALGIGLPTGIGWGIGMWAVFELLQTQKVPAWAIAIAAAWMGILFGVAMAASFSRGGRKYGLRQWRDL